MGPRITRRDIPEELRRSHRLSVIPLYLLKYFGKNNTEARAGICGAPVVHEPNDDPALDGIVVGFGELGCIRTQSHRRPVHDFRGWVILVLKVGLLVLNLHTPANL